MTPKYHHYGSRYARLTPEALDHCVEVVRDAHEVLHGAIGFDAADMVVVASEVLASERWLARNLTTLPDAKFDGTWDLTRISAAELLDAAAKQVDGQGYATEAASLRAQARALLDQAVRSLWRSPAVSYEAVFSALLEGCERRRDPQDLDLAARKLHYVLDAMPHNAANALRQLAELRRRHGDVEGAVAIFEVLLRHDAEDVWTYQSIAFELGRAQPALGRAALERALSLPSDEAKQLAPQLRRLVAELPQPADGPLDKGSAALLAQLHERPTRSRRTLRKLCEPVVPELSWLPTKVRPPLPDEAGLTDLRRGLATLPLPRPSEAKLVVRARAETAELRPPSRAAPAPIEARGSAASWAKVGRNDPCPCGSGKKHKRCCG